MKGICLFLLMGLLLSGGKCFSHQGSEALSDNGREDQVEEVTETETMDFDPTRVAAHIIKSQGDSERLMGQKFQFVEAQVDTLMRKFWQHMTFADLDENHLEEGYDIPDNDYRQIQMDTLEKRKSFLSLFHDNVLNEKILHNIYRNKPLDRRDDDAIYHEEHISPVDHANIAVEHMFEINLRAQNVIVDHDIYAYRGSTFIEANVNLVSSLLRPERADDFQLSDDNELFLSVMIELSDWSGVVNGAQVPLEYRIISVDHVPDERITTERLPRRNFWMFANLEVKNNLMGGELNGAFPAFENLTTSPLHSYGVKGSLSLFFRDTTYLIGSERANLRLWDTGINVGLGFIRQNMALEMNHYQTTKPIDETPLQNVPLYGNSTLFIEGHDIVQNATIDVLTIPVSLTLKRYFTRNKVHSLVLETGVSYNVILRDEIVQKSGHLSAAGHDIRFNDEDGFDPVSIETLPDYGFGQEFPVLLDEEVASPFASDYLSLHLRLGIHLRQTVRDQRLNYTITPWITYGLSNVIDRGDPFETIGYEEAIENTINGPQIGMGHLFEGADSFKPLSFGINLGISYNILRNKQRTN